MLGLGLGSLAGGWLSKRRGIPLLPLLAIIELLTGAFGVVSHAIFDHVGALTAGWPLPATAAINLSLVIVPTLLMGATLPDRKSTRLNSSHLGISYAVFCLK